MTQDFTNELRRLSALISTERNPVLIDAAKEKRDWVLEFVERELSKRGQPRSRRPTLSKLEDK